MKEQNESNDNIMNVQEVAKLFKCSTRTIYKMIEKGELPHVRIGTNIKFRRDILLDLMK